MHERQQKAIAAVGIVAVEAIRDRAVKQRDESNARTAKRIWSAKLHWGDLTYPSSSGGSPKLQRRPPKTIVASRKRRFMHHRPRFVPRRPRCVLWTPSGGCRIGQVSPLQFCGPYSRLFAVRALLSSPCRTALSPIASSTAIPPARSAPGMDGLCSSLPSMSAAADAAACLRLLLLLIVARRRLFLLLGWF